MLQYWNKLQKYNVVRNESRLSEDKRTNYFNLMTK